MIHVKFMIPIHKISMGQDDILPTSDVNDGKKR